MADPTRVVEASWISHLLHILDLRTRRRIGGLVGMMVVAAAVEAFGIGLIMPFIAAVSGPESVARSALVQHLFSWSAASSWNDFMFLAAVALLTVFIAKNAFLALLAYVQAKVGYSAYRSLSQRLMHAYLTKPYAFHLQRNSAELIRNVTLEVNGVITGILLPLLGLLAEVLVLVALLALLLAVDAIVAIAAIGSLAVAAWLAQRFMKQPIERFGQHRLASSADQIRWLNQGIGSVKETKLLGREAFFESAFARANTAYTEASRVIVTLNQLPRLLIETFTVTGMLIVVMVLLARGADPAATVPLLGLFGMAAIRVMPSTSKILTSLNSIRYYHSTVESVWRDIAGESSSGAAIHEARHDPVAPSNSAPRLELKGVCFRYQGAHRFAVENISLDVQPESTFGIVGPSGSGKSTLLDVMLGLLEPQQGRILFDGVDLTAKRSELQASVGYVPQTVYLTDDTIRRNVAFGYADNEIDDEALWQALRQARLEDFVRAQPAGLDSVVGERGVRISGGERQRIGIARALFNEPRLLVFDEATSAVDNKTEQEIADIIYSLTGGRTVIIVAHRISTVRRCQRIVYLREGQIAGQGTFDELMQGNAAFRETVTDGAAA
jgi:ATP-binding cassette, subfamily B, bacterial PglK